MNIVLVQNNDGSENMKDFRELRNAYPQFIYHAYHMDENQESIRFWYDFEIVGLATFHPSWTIAKKHIKYFDMNDEIIKNLVFHIGLVELSSYWKITCSPMVRVDAGYLDETAINWWKKQYYWGLGEFFYTNHIEVSMEAFMTMKSYGQAFQNLKNQRLHDGNLIPIGGGKDSIVTLELLKDCKKENTCYIINARGATKNTVLTAGYADEDCVEVTRTLDQEMLRLNKEGFLNGHTPFSALVAFSSTLFAYMRDLRYVVLSNEDSANESTVSGTNINHQYSKSFQFEADFQSYEQRYIHSDVTYFSLLRGFSEFQIGAYFAKQKTYHEIFRSCNVGSKQDIWCCNCPKCLFVYLILSPFLTTQEAISMFKENLLEKDSLIDTMEKLIGYQSEKPFECVGSREEVNTAICMKIAQMKEHHESLPLLFEHYMNLPQYQEYKDAQNPYASYFNKENLIPEQFLPYLQGAYE